MPELSIRPSTTLVKARYAFAVLLILIIFYLRSVYPSQAWWAAFALPVILIVTTAIKHVKRRFVTMDLVGDRLKYSAGMASKTERSIPLHKVQDVTVRQTLFQRLLGLGDISLETAGDASRLTMEEIDAPRVVAEKILDRVATLNKPK
jgi:putative membrane protein